MSLALQRSLKPSTGHPVWTEPAEAETRLKITVVFTTVDATLAALRKAGGLANRLGAHITLMVPQVVPYPLPLKSPPVLIDWNERRFRVIAEESLVETTVHLYLCRDRGVALLTALSPQSMIVMGGPKRWWPTPETRLARKLRNAGHQVILVETE